MPPIEPPKIAMVMAAGLGTRMRPITNTIPKPLVQVVGKALIDYSLDFLAASGVTEAIVNSHYLAEMLEAHLLARCGLPKIHILREDVVLETGGGIKNALPLLGKLSGNAPFFVVNSDVICIDGKIPALHQMWQHWDDSEMDALLLLHKVEDAVGYDGKGDFFINDDGKLRRRVVSEIAPYVFTGVQIISPRLFIDSPDGAFSLNVLYNKNLGRIGTLIHDGNWLHVGSQAELSQVENWMSSHH